MNFYNYYTDIEGLEKSEESGLFPPRFILSVVKKSGCDKSLDTNVTVTLYKEEKERSVEQQPVCFNHFVPISTTAEDSTRANVQKDYSLHFDDQSVSAADLPHPIQHNHPSEQEDSSLYVYGCRYYPKSESTDSITDYDYDYAYHATSFPLRKGKNPLLKGKSPLHLINEHDCHSNKPKLADLTNYSANISWHWEEIALKLNIPQPDIDTINIDYAQQVKKKCNAMFSKWLDKTVEAYWCKFIQALYHVGLDSVAEEAKQHIITKSSCVASRFENIPSSDESNPVDIHELEIFLKDIPKVKKKYFVKRLLPKQIAIRVIKDIRYNGGSTQDNTLKICKAFLEEDPSWSKVYQALKEAECDDLADYIEASFLPL